MATALPPKKKAPASDKLQNIKVMVRVRPLNKSELEMHVRTVVKCVSQREIMTKEKKFTFDRVFKPQTEQIEIYKALVAPMIPDVLNGYNCTVFAYGPTGSGKTYTMTGTTCQAIENWREDPVAGCIPRGAAHIFEDISALTKNEINVKVSYLELYNEEIRDLLSDDDSVLPIYNDTKGMVFIQNLTEVSVYDSTGLCKQLQKGVTKRQTAPTLMNHQSSRSHTVFTITINSRETTVSGEDILKSGKINLVDLAGSENIARSGCKDLRAVELANINKSLLTLGRVIHALADKSPKHVPYRDSKLTRILQDSLGGHTKTAIIATISPAATSYDETISTLDYASRARDIKNTPTMNQKLTKAQMIQGLLNEIDRLQRDLDAARDKSGFYVNKENYEKLIDSVEFVTGEKLTMEELARKQSARIKELEEILNTKLREFDDNVIECKRNKELLRLAKTVIIENKQSLEQERFVSQVYEAQAGDLHQDVKKLITTTETLSEERGILQDKLEQQYHINMANESAGRTAVNQVIEMLKKISEEEIKFKASDERISTLSREDIADLKVSIEQTLVNLQTVLDEFAQSNIQDDALKETLETTLNNYITTVKTKSADLKRNLEEHLKHLDQFEKIDFPVFLGQFKELTNQFTAGISGVIAEMQDELNHKDKDLADAVAKLKNDVEEEKKLYESRIQRDNEILNQLANIEELIAKKHEMRCEKVMKQMQSREENFHTLTSKMIDAVNNMDPERVSSRPLPSVTDEFNEAATNLHKEVMENIQEIEEAQKSKNTETFSKLTETVTEHFAAISTVLETKVNTVNTRLDFLMDDREMFEETLEECIKKANQALTDGFLEKVVPVSHAGDTPLRTTIVIPTPVEPHPRQALIERFKQERPVPEVGEDKENLPGELNISTLFDTSFRMSTSDLSLGDLGQDSP